MNPLAIGLIALGIVFLLFGVSCLVKNKRTMGWVLSIVGLLAIAAPFLISYFLLR